MGSSMIAAFRKQKTCPSAEMLLLYQGTGLTLEKRREVAAHLAACDFCGAELHLLARHPPVRVVCGKVKMPLHLRQLAEVLLADMTYSIKKPAEVMSERARLSLTDA